MSTLKVDAITNLSNATAYQPTLMTAQASTSGTSIDFLSIPSWVKRITVMINGVSTNGTSCVQIQLGTSSGVTTSGYLTSASGSNASATAAALFTSGFSVDNATSSSAITTAVRHGLVTFCRLDTSNIWVGSGMVSHSDAAWVITTSGSITLAATLDRVRVTTVNGTDTFDAGSINVMYE